MSKFQLNFRASFCRGPEMNLTVPGTISESADGQGVDCQRAQALDGGEGLHGGVPRHQPRRERQVGKRHSGASVPARTVRVSEEEGEGGARADVLDYSQAEAPLEQVPAQVK